MLGNESPKTPAKLSSSTPSLFIKSASVLPRTTCLAFTPPTLTSSEYNEPFTLGPRKSVSNNFPRLFDVLESSGLYEPRPIIMLGEPVSNATPCFCPGEPISISPTQFDPSTISIPTLPEFDRLASVVPFTTLWCLPVFLKYICAFFAYFAAIRWTSCSKLHRWLESPRASCWRSWMVDWAEARLEEATRAMATENTEIFMILGQGTRYAVRSSDLYLTPSDPSFVPATRSRDHKSLPASCTTIARSIEPWR